MTKNSPQTVKWQHMQATKNDLVLVMILNDDLGGKIVKRSLTELGE